MNVVYYTNIRIEEAKGAFWAIYQDGDRLYKSNTPCASQEEAEAIGVLQAIKIRAKQDVNPVLLIKCGWVVYVNLTALELGYQVGDRAPENRISECVSETDIEYLVLVL